MTPETRQTQPAVHYEVTAGPNGRVEFVGPFQHGQRLTVFVLPGPQEFEDLTAAAATSLDFWDNPLDDEDWNEAPSS